MRNTFCIKFYCRKGNARKNGLAPVEVSVIVRGERQMWQLPKKCKPDEFQDDSDIKAYCTAIENKLNNIYTNLVINNEPITAFIIKDIFANGNERKSYTIKQMFEDGLKVKKAERTKIDTYNKYKAVTEKFYELTGLNEKKEARAVTHSHILLFKAEVEKIHQPQTVFKEMQQLKFFFQLAFSSGKIPANPFLNLKIKSGAHDKPFLTYEEITTIRNLQLTSDRLDKVRDVFIFMCFTGLEWADVEALKAEDIQKNELGQYYIRKKRVKTGIEYITILHENVYEIWDFYNGLPLCSPQKFNAYLKEIVEKAQIKKAVTSLTARHSFACYLLSTKGLSCEIVQRMLGHKNIQQTQHYAKMFPKPVFEANASAEKKKTKKGGENFLDRLNRIL